MMHNLNRTELMRLKNNEQMKCMLCEAEFYICASIRSVGNIRKTVFFLSFFLIAEIQVNARNVFLLPISFISTHVHVNR